MNGLHHDYIYQFSLGKNYDVSTATKVGRTLIGATIIFKIEN